MTSITGPSYPVKGSVNISGSKSLSNRLLILGHLYNFKLPPNLSESEDTRLLLKAIEQVKKGGGEINVGHAGTNMRFLTALLTISDGVFTLTGSDQLKKRPIGNLVSALNDAGGRAEYLEKENFPPLRITGGEVTGGGIEINGSVSSQFISALLMVAPKFRKGITLNITGEIVSRPYIDMTISLLKDCNIGTEWHDKIISILPLKEKVPPIIKKIESDWSSASYWYSVCALSPGSSVDLRSFSRNSLQADAVLPVIFDKLGVSSRFRDDTLELRHKGGAAPVFEYDFSDCPDIAQTIAVTCFGLGTGATLTGLSTLRIKETDRITALKNELEKLGANIIVDNNMMAISGHPLPAKDVIIETYHDHRMALSFAPLALTLGEIAISDFEVVNKSYPAFKRDLLSLGFNVNLRPS